MDRAEIQNRQGSVLIVVIGLLLLVMLIGITFFTFANQEHSSAEYYADSAKVFSISPDMTLFEMALEQLIIGPHDDNIQSVLYPGKYSLVPNMIGMFGANPNGRSLTTIPLDRHPYTGGFGINIISGPFGQPILDQNFNGKDDALEGLPNYFDLIKNINLSGAVQLSPTYGISQASSRQADFNNFPAIDVGYTYPDINNLFLAHIGTTSVPSPTVGNPPNVYSVITPSFIRPGYLRDAGGNPNNNWQTDLTVGPQQLRPHQQHLCVVKDSTGNYPFRYLTAAKQIPGSVPPHWVQPFNFATTADMGIWSNNLLTAAGWDADNDNDGIFEGIWLDLGLPTSILLDGRISVPLVSYTVLEADSLINLNTDGNISGFSLSQPAIWGRLPSMLGSNFILSRSNLGRSPSEINPEWALTSIPGTLKAAATNLQQYRGFYNVPNQAGFTGVDRVELANMDQLFLLWGRPSYSVTTNAGNDTFTLNDLTGGLWGELSALKTGAQAAQNNNPFAASMFPRPGQSGVDDNGDQNVGVAETDSLLTNVLIPPYFQPLDFSGAGSFLSNTGTNGMIADLVAPATVPGSQARFLRYSDYQMQYNMVPPPPPFFPNPAGSYVTLGRTATTAGVYQLLFGGNYLSQNPYYLANLAGVVDEAYEVVTDPRYQQASDQMFAYDEMAGLQLVDPDYKTIQGQSRLKILASANFNDDNNAQAIRQRFTVSSSDRRHHGFAFNPSRPWEYGVALVNPAMPGNVHSNLQPATVPNNWDSSGAPQFPPQADPSKIAASSQQPFRNEVAALIGVKTDNARYDILGNQTYPNAFNTPAYDFPTPPNSNPGINPWLQQSRLNINRLLTTLDPSSAFSATNPLVYRELTPHPQGNLTSAEIRTMIAPFPPTTFNPGSFTANAAGAALQEYWARRDRQQLARDIYVMLYMFGGGQDGVNYATTPNAITGNDPSDPTNTLKLRVLYSDRQLAEMAQFAVNYVDALDRDDTITLFEYDKDLSDGWNLDDNPYTSSTSVPPVAGEMPTVRGLAYGVEMQTLVISEALFVQFKQITTSDITATPFNDTQADRYFSYIELENVAPADVHLDSSGTKGCWRIQLQSDDLTFTPKNVKINGLNKVSNVIPSSNRFVISNVGRSDNGVDMVGASPSVARGSDLRISCFDNGAKFDLIAPNVNEAVSPPQNPPTTTPMANIDLVQDRDYGSSAAGSNDNGVFTLTDTSGNLITIQGGLLNTAAGTQIYAITLQRRANLNRTAPLTSDDTDPQNTDNPWITVDRLGAVDPQTGRATDGATLQLSGVALGDTSATLAAKLQSNVKSSERKWLLDATKANLKLSVGYSNSPPNFASGETFTTAQQSYAKNTLSRIQNSAAPMPPLQAGTPPWQPHFDRDFSSVMELLSIPLYGPERLTTALSVNGTLAAECDVSGPTAMVTVQMTPANYEARVAQARFFRPQHPFNIGQAPASTNPLLDNRWHRILELLDVPTRENMQIDNILLLPVNFPWLSPQPQQRVPGRMNLNGMRFPENLFALLDDPNQFDIYNYRNDGSYADRYEGIPKMAAGLDRNWWQQLLIARDGSDPQFKNTLGLGAGQSAPLPGSPAARPFRSYSFSERNPEGYTQYPPGTPVAAGTALPACVDDTLLRTLPIDPVNGTATSPLDQRRLLEARSNADRQSVSSASGTPDTVDYYTRNRLLAKIANNTTNRSNVFIVWISIGFFEGYQDPASPGVTQIGSEMTTPATRSRGFFIVDRSQLEDAWNSTTGTYDFRKFVQYRKIIQ